MISDRLLERYHLGEVNEAERQHLELALRTEGMLLARLAELRESDAAIRAAYPGPLLGNAALKSYQPLNRPPVNLMKPALAVAFTVVLGLVGFGTLRGATSVPDDIRLKGGSPSLTLYRLANNEPERLFDKAAVKPRQRIQVAFDLAGSPHLAVVSVDGLHHVTKHWPPNVDSLAPPGFKALDQSFELDEAPDFERFFLVTSAQPIDIALVIRSAGSSGPTGELRLPDSMRQQSILLQKAAP
jgi:hypothetical protein